MRPRVTLLVAAACVACVLSTRARPASAQEESVGPEARAVAPAPVLEGWHEGEPIPPGYARSQRTRRGLVIGGAVLFGSTYAVNLLGVAGNNLFAGQSRENWLALPGIGPLAQMVRTTNPLGNVFLGIDAVAQLGGIAMLAYGLASPTTVLVYEDRTVVSFAITPMVGAGRTGVGLVGSF